VTRLGFGGANARGNGCSTWFRRFVTRHSFL